MKNMRKVLSLVLALVMILSLSVTASATETTPRVDVAIKTSSGAVTESFSIPANAGDSLYAVVDDYDGTADWETVSDYYNPSQTHEALTEFEGKSSTPLDTTEGSADLAAVKTALSAQGYSDEVINAIAWRTGTNAGYGLISSTTSGTTTTYTYVYAGYDWTYSSDLNGEIWTYMCCYNLSAGEVVSLTYGFNVSVFNSTNLIP